MSSALSYNIFQIGMVIKNTALSLIQDPFELVHDFFVLPKESPHKRSEVLGRDGNYQFLVLPKEQIHTNAIGVEETNITEIAS